MHAPQKNQPRPFDAYVLAHQRAYAWAEKALGYRYAGKLARANAAVEKTKYWLRKIVALEALAAESRGSPIKLASSH